jgi:hypothetical protein
MLPLFKVLDDDIDLIENQFVKKIMNEMSHRLLTVCTVYDECPYIMYQGKSEFMKQLAESLHENLKAFFAR